MQGAADEIKRALRAEVRARRAARTPAAAAAAAADIRIRLDALVDAVGARTVSCYLSTATEPGTREFVTAAVARGIRVLLPVSRDDGTLGWIPAGGAVVAGRFGLPEPVGEPVGPDALADLDLMIVPAAAVDRGGVRLGWGRGYIDRALAALPSPPPVYAVVYDDEILDAVPAESHDQPVTGVVTPTLTIALAPAAH